MPRPTAICLLVCLCLFGCGLSGVLLAPSGFPPQLLAFSGPIAAFGLDGKAWDAYGIGGPSNVLFLKGEYWICTAGYPSAGFTAQALGCWHGPGMDSLKPYSGNPILVNSRETWSASCIEGPDLNTDGENVYVSFLGFRADCDAEGTGAIGIVSTTIANWPDNLSGLPAKPQMPQPSQLNWLYRAFIVEIGGICLDYSNGGDSSSQPVIVSFRTNGPCAATEVSGPWIFNRIEFGVTHPEYEGTLEIQDPQVFQAASGLWIMVYGNSLKYTGSYAATTDPIHGTWTKLGGNPLSVNGQLWLPRIAQDGTGQYWMFGNFNNTTQMNLWKASGP